MSQLANRVYRAAKVLSFVATLLLGPPSIFADVATPKCDIGPWAKGIEVGPGMDASGRILRGCRFVGLDLQSAKFDGADLAGCEFFQCDLRKATFKKTILTGLKWGECRIEDADFSDAVINGIIPIGGVSGYGIEFTAEQFMSTYSYRRRDLSACIVVIVPRSRTELATPRFDFRDANLENARVVSVDLTQSVLADAVITGMGVTGGKLPFHQVASTKNYRDGNLHNVAFGGVDVVEPWDLSSMDLRGASFIGAGLLARATLTDAKISDCTFRCGVTKEQLVRTRDYREGRLRNVKIWNVDFNGADLRAMDLSGCRFHGCTFSEASIDDSVISDASFLPGFDASEMPGLTVDQIKSTWNHKHDRMDGIELPESIAKALDAEQRDDK